jgi:hypothetical protein
LNCLPGVIADKIHLAAVTEVELKQVEVLFNEATDNCINLKKPEYHACNFRWILIRFFVVPDRYWAFSLVSYLNIVHGLLGIIII